MEISIGRLNSPVQQMHRTETKRKAMTSDTTSFFSHQATSTRKKRLIKTRTAARYFMVWLKNYCENTSLHGFKYLVQRGTSVYEKLFWTVAILVMLIGSWWLIFDQIVSFVESPTLITFESSQRAMRTVPFPAVTICPGCQLHESIFNMTWALENRDRLNEEEKRMFDFSMVWCVKYMKNSTIWGEKMFNSSTVRRFSSAVNGPKACQEFVPVLFWSGIGFHNACSLTQPIETRFGACFSFNLQPIDQVLKHKNLTAITDTWATHYLSKESVWNQDDGYMKSTDGIPLEERTTPWSAGDGGIFNRLYLLLRIPRQGFDKKCRNNEFIGIFHSPSELPNLSHSIFTLKRGQAVTAFLTPRLYSIDPRLTKWEPLKRGCYLQTERSLQYFTTYTQRNCLLECALNLSLSLCGCAPFNYPRYNDTPICGSIQHECYSNTKDKVDSSACGCLPGCFDMDFEIDTLVKFTKTWPEVLLDYTPDWSKYWYTSVDLQYKMRFAQGVRRDVQFGLSNLIANVGGLFSLFLGFTLMSLFEVVYFLTFKSWNYFKKVRRQRLIAPQINELPNVYY